MFMNDEVIKALEDKGFASLSIKTFDAQIKRIHYLLYGKQSVFNMNNLVKDYKKVIKILASDDIPYTSKKIIYHSIGNVIKIMELKSFGAQELLRVRDLVSVFVDDQRKFQTSKSVIPLNQIYPKIKKTFEELEDLLSEEYNPKIDIAYVAMAFFVYLPPLRAQDYVKTRLKFKAPNDDEEQGNYIDLKNSIMIINEYKTAKKYGKRSILIPPPLNEILLNYKRKSRTKWLIPKIYGDENVPMSVSSFTHMLNRILDEKISTTELRRAYISDKVINKDMKGKNRKYTAKIMGHSTTTQNEIYSKYSKIAD